MDWLVNSLIVCFLLVHYGDANYRLPKTLVPKDYQLQIDTFLDEPVGRQFYFNGYVSIKIFCKESTNKIVLHSLNLKHRKNHLASLSNNATIQIVKTSYDPVRQFYIMHLSKHMKRNNFYQLKMHFSGDITTGLRGYYRSSYRDDKNKKHWLAVTQFEPADARQAFPCFDEPSFKATFEISLKCRHKYKALSNMPLVKKIHDNYRDEYYFSKSVPMSTYLVGYSVSEFVPVTSKKNFKNNVTVSMWATEEHLDQTKFALEVAPMALHFFEEYFKVNYPLPKQDFLAIPDFSSNAMENWGIITFRETELLAHPKIASVAEKKKIAYIVAHELAHQWFGNLVTMEWWSDLWLNEGFATYMGCFATNDLFPQWRVMDIDSVAHLNMVFDLDALRSSHPIYASVNNPGEIKEIFDAISYKKGFLVLRMMSHILGEEVLRAGISDYLKRFAYSNADQDDLWRSLNLRAHSSGVLPSNLTVKRIMDSWTLQTGYPVVTVTRNYRNNEVQISQERFLKDRSVPKSDKRYKWWISITHTTQKEKNFHDTKPKLWLSDKNKFIQINNVSPKEWIIFNIQAAGIYRVNYDTQNWNMLATYLKYGRRDKIPELNRVLLIDDVMELAWMGKVRYDTALNLVSYIRYETNYLPWKAALTKLKQLSNLISITSAFPGFRIFMRNILSQIYKDTGRLNFDNINKNSLTDVLHKKQIISAACLYSIGNCRKGTKSMFHLWKTRSIDLIPKEIREIVYCQAIRAGNKDDFMFLWNKFEKEKSGVRKLHILGGLGCTTDRSLLKRYLDWSICKNCTDIRKYEMMKIFTSVAGSRVGFYVATTFLEKNIAKIHQRMHPTEYRMGMLVKSLAKNVMNNIDLHRFAKLIGNNEQYFSKAKLATKQALEMAKINVQWHEENYISVKTLLDKITKYYDY